MKKKLFLIYGLISISLFIILALSTQNVPLFADGSQHAGIIREINKTGNIPLEDFQGTQRNNFNSPVSIRTPFLYYPLFYVLGAEVFISISNLTCSLFLIDLLSILISAFLIFIIFRKIFNLKIAILMFTLFLLSNFWLWELVHRLMEPVITLIFLTILYLIFLYNNLNKKELFLFALFFSSLLLLKQSSLFILPPLFIPLIYKFRLKKSLSILFIFLLLITPAMIYLISNTGSIGLTPPGIPIIDQYILHPWWNSSPSAWESTLDILSDSESLRKITLIQFNNIQISPLNLFKNHNYLGIVQEFFIYPVMSQGHQGYSPITQEYTFKIFCFLLIFSLVFSFKINYKKIKPDLKLFIVGVISLLIFTLIGWARSPVFRYFIFIDFLMLILLVLPILEFKKINKKIAILIIFIVMMSICINLASEVKRDNNYIYTVGHQALISQNGGIFESIELSKFIKDNTPTDSFVFTNIAEVGFYSERKIIWDDRLFFIKNKDDLKKILKNYNFDYLVIPYYSGVESYDNWKYYQGIPKDSEFNKLLLDNSVFTKIKVYNSSTLYRFNKNET